MDDEKKMPAMGTAESTDAYMDELRWAIEKLPNDSAEKVDIGTAFDAVVEAVKNERDAGGDERIIRNELRRVILTGGESGGHVMDACRLLNGMNLRSEIAYGRPLYGSGIAAFMPVSPKNRE